MKHTHARALEYIQNTGGHPNVEWFDDDHDPIGPTLRAEMTADGLIYEQDGKIHVSPKS